eukprot:XP_001701992.1 predicted protein [Chlamydomonas reinhardtii]
MASLYEAVELPTISGQVGRCVPQNGTDLTPELTVASLLTAALESFVPESVGRAYHAVRACTLGRTPLSNVVWLHQLEAANGCTLVLDRHGLTARGGLLPDDHLQQPSCAATVLNVYALATDVCGHKGVVHGGLSSALLDESFGYLLYLLASTAAEKESRALRPELPSAALKSAMTAHLEVDFVRPLLPESVVVCVAQVEKVEGRKVWLRAELLSRAPTAAVPGEAAPVVYARGRALFVTPRH